MAVLLDLPNEILIEILCYTRSYDCERMRPSVREAMRPSVRETCEVALTCRRLRILAQPVIFQEINTAATDTCLTHSINKCIIHFMRSLEELPELADMVRYATFRWRDYELVDDRNFRKLISRLPSLRALSIYISSKWPAVHYPDLPSIASLSQLTTLQLVRRCTIPAEVLTYMSIPTLQSFDLSGTIFAKSSTWPDNPSPETYKIKTLKVAHIGNKTLGHLLRRTPFLQNLNFRIGRSNFTYREKRYYISVLALAEILKPVLNDLEALTIWMKMHASPVGTLDNLRLDLSMVKNLRKIICPGYFFFPIEADSNLSTRGNISKLLPSSVEELEIKFEHDRHIVTPPEDGKPQRYSASDAEKYCTELSWLLELFESKVMEIPRLRVLKLFESFDQDKWLRHIDTISWEPPIEVRDSALEAEVDLEFSVCRKLSDIESWYICEPKED